MKKILIFRFLLLGIIPGLFFLSSCTHLKTSRTASVPQASGSASQPSAAVPLPEARPDPTRMFVEDMLVSKGLRREKVHALMSDPRVSVSSNIIVTNLFHSAPAASAKNPKVMEVNLKYIDKGVEFINEHRKAFDQVWERYRISPEVITSILILETNLGKYPMKYNVFKVYASLTTALDVEYLDSVLKPKGEKYALTDAVLKSARSKGNWGLGELAALIQLSEKLGIDPIGINGSFAGALGPAQFIPTSFVKFGVDGNGDNKIDPFEMDDCIASIANYLKLAGWKEDAKLEQKKQAIWTYNHHDVYVNTILMLNDKLIEAGEQMDMPDADQPLEAGPGIPAPGSGQAAAPAGDQASPPAAGGSGQPGDAGGKK